MMTLSAKCLMFVASLSVIAAGAAYGQGLSGPQVFPAGPIGFEAAEGFAPGYCVQNGWTAFVASTAEGQVSTVHPATGLQHLLVGLDPANGINTLIGCFSPDFGPHPNGLVVFSVMVAITSSGGADYDVVAQSPTQGFITARVKFDWLGNIMILDDPGGGLGFYDSSVDWIADGEYHPLEIVVNSNAGVNTIDYSYDGVPIYAGNVFAGTAVDQFVLFHDNYNVQDWGEFDDLSPLGEFPVELVGFRATPRDAASAIDLTWETASETDNVGFTVEVAATDGSWVDAGWVEGAGTTEEKHTYSYRVSDLEPGTYRFRLRQVDLDGTIEYSSTVEATLSVPGDYFLSDAYPNPFNPVTRFAVAVPFEQHVRVTVHDMLGRKVQTLLDAMVGANERTEVMLDGDGLTSGTYLYRVTGANFSASKTVTLLR